MKNRLFVQVRVRLVLCLLAFSFFAITADAGSAVKWLKSASYMQPYSTTLQSSFGTPPYTYALTSGGLPPGITLDQSGNITGTPTSTGTWTFQITATDSSQPPQYQTIQYGLSVSLGLDLYGGLTALPSPGGATGYFRVEKNTSGRWLFVSPLGNYFWMFASYVESPSFLQTSPTNVLTVKYGANKTNWATHQNSRLLSWQFNTIGEYATTYVLPVNTNRFQNNANPVKLPFVPLVNAMVTMQLWPTTIGLPEAPKDLIKGVPSTITVWRNSVMTDVFDPKVKTGYQNEMAYQNTATYTNGFNSTPWILGITPDDTDYLFGLKNSGTTPVSPHPNIGFIAAVTKFDYTGVGGPWIDPKLYSKYAWTCGVAGIDFGFGVGRGYLDSKYGTIAALNAAWGTSNFYTSFCDAGGYGVGRGVLDEDGRHTAWMGHNAYTLVGTNANVAADMNQFVYDYAYKYASTAVAAIRTVDTHHLIFGPASLSAGGYQDRPQVLQAFSDAGINVIQMSASPTGDFSGYRATYDLIGKPIYLWYAISANADSALYSYVSGQGVPDYGTQANRGIHYGLDLNSFLAATATNGDNYMLGIDWWEHTDGNFAEKTNWGLVTDRDNAYNSIEDVNHQVRDSGGYLTVPEDRSYGDFITPVTATNSSILQQLIYEGQH